MITLHKNLIKIDEIIQIDKLNHGFELILRKI